MTISYDIAVIGAGPAGLCAAYAIAEASSSAKVVLIDKTQPWNNPIACAEGVGRLGFHEALTPREEWVRCTVGSATYYAPNGTAVTYADSNKGYVINRNLMQRDLATMCADKGVECSFDTAVQNVSEPAPQGGRTIRLSNGTYISALVVIDCSGPLSKIGREESLAWKALDLEAAFFAHIDNIKTETDTVRIFMSQEFAPGGYGWSFPRNDHSTNAGILIGSRFRKSANIRRNLDSFIKRYFSGGTVVGTFSGTIPCYSVRQPMALAGLLKAGDAASTVNPISRAGIVEAMLCGKLAGTTALQMLGAVSQRELVKFGKVYEKTWHEKRGKYHLKLARVKSEFCRISDPEFNAAATALSAVPQADLTMAKIFRISLGRFPRLVWAMRHLM
jgi:digeranylgeranylglycerophospholipid reductase